MQEWLVQTHRHSCPDTKSRQCVGAGLPVPSVLKQVHTEHQMSMKLHHCVVTFPQESWEGESMGRRFKV